MLWSDLVELKSMLEIDPEDRSEDVRLAFWLKMACDVLESYVGPVYRRERTEYHGGSGTNKLLLRVCPAYADPVPQVWVDESGKFGVTSGSFVNSPKLEYGKDFSLWLDHESDVTRSDRGILLRNSGFWNKASVRSVGFLSPYVQDNPGTIKVTYVGGRYAEDLPYDMVLACVQTVGRIRFMMPLGLPLNSDTDGDGRAVTISGQEKNWLIGQVKHLLFNHRKNRRF